MAPKVEKEPLIMQMAYFQYELLSVTLYTVTGQIAAHTLG